MHEYTNVLRWTDRIAERPAVRRGRMVNRTWGQPSSQLHERHDASDFDTRTQDKLSRRGLMRDSRSSVAAKAPTMTMTLYDCSTAPSPRRARILLAEKGVRHDTVQIDLRAGEQLGEAFRRVNPQMHRAGRCAPTTACC